MDLVTLYIMNDNIECDLFTWLSSETDEMILGHYRDAISWGNHSGAPPCLGFWVGYTRRYRVHYLQMRFPTAAGLVSQIRCPYDIWYTILSR